MNRSAKAILSQTLIIYKHLPALIKVQSSNLNYLCKLRIEIATI